MEPKGRRNVYTCNTCHGRIVTVLADEGVTPSMMACRVNGEPRQPGNLAREAFLARAGTPPPPPQCQGRMLSGWYHLDRMAAREAPTHEWFRPADLSGYGPEDREYFDKGGLELRRIPEAVRS